MVKSKKFKVLIAAGGTGGHIFPALALAKEVLAMEGGVVAWLGTKKGLEAKIIPVERIKLRYIWVWGVRGNGVLVKLASPFKILVAIVQSVLIMLQFKPNVILGMGGFVSGPAGIAAWLLRIPLVIHEQNSIAGLTNKILARFASVVLQGFPQSFKNLPKAVFTGNPVRKEISPKNSHIRASRHFKILIIGGSRGAAVFNKILPGAIASSSCAQQISVWHQTGDDLYKPLAEDAYKGVQAVRIDTFITDMAAAYSWADLVICRAGALTIAELAIAGIASILVPFPQAVDDHQRYNAKYLSDNKAAILLLQADLTAENLSEILEKLYANPNEMQAMAQNSRTLAMPDALNKVLTCCLAAGGRSDG
jgi:UDP-N-acetylglucosamine--N-acetylmuramyl-(pentapeptide) pyrophosphoryl-undecaprenol N-acetylglucosamine transferase